MWCEWEYCHSGQPCSIEYNLWETGSWYLIESWSGMRQDYDSCETRINQRATGSAQYWLDSAPLLQLTDWQNNPNKPSRINSFKDVFYISSQEFITYPRSNLIKFLHKIKKCMDQSICRCFSAWIKWTVRIHIHINTFQRLQSAAASAIPFPPQFWLKFFFYIFIFTLRNN